MIIHRMWAISRVLPLAITPLVALAWLQPLLSPAGSTSPDDAVTSALWWVALGLAVWMALSVVGWAFNDVGRPSERSTALLSRLALPGSKRLARAMLATTALLVSACSDATAAPVLRAVETNAVETNTVETSTVETSTVEVAPDSPLAPAVSSSIPEAERSVETDVEPEEARDAIEPPPLEVGVDPHPLVAPIVTQTPTDHVVAEGDSLWSIAEAHLLASDPEASASDVANYWRMLVAENAPSLKSGEPNLIYVGETLTLPVLTAS